MMEKYNKKGFTLVELIIVIAIIAALSVTMGVSTVQTKKSSTYKEYREKYATIFSAAKLYIKLKQPVHSCAQTGDAEILCTKDQLVTSAVTSIDGEDVHDKTVYAIPLCCLVESGLLDEDYFTMHDPMSGIDEAVFELNRGVLVYKVDGELKSAMADEYESTFITTDNIEDFDCWEGTC